MDAEAITLLTPKDIEDFKAGKALNIFETKLIDTLECEWETVRRLNGTIDDAGRKIERLEILIAGVIDRCEATGYVGQDGQYLKELKRAVFAGKAV